MSTIKNRLSKIDTTVELTGFYSEGIAFDEFIENVTNGIYQDEITYYHLAMEYLKREDTSLSLSIELYMEQGGTLEGVNSEVLATVLYQYNQLEELYQITKDIEEAFNH